MPEPMLTYTQPYTVYRHDGDHHGNVKPAALLRYGQQIATIHAEAVGLNDALYAATHTAYVLAKQALRIDRTPRVDEVLTVVTQPERCKRCGEQAHHHLFTMPRRAGGGADSAGAHRQPRKGLILRKHPEGFGDNWAPDVPF